MWSRQVGLGLDSGGGAIMWGSAADDRWATFRSRAPAGRSVSRRCSLATGEVAWRASPPEGGARAGHRDSRRRVLRIERRERSTRTRRRTAKRSGSSTRRASSRPSTAWPPRAATINAAGPGRRRTACCSCRRAIPISATALAATSCWRFGCLRARCKIDRSAALQGCPAAVGRPEGLRYERPPLILQRALNQHKGHKGHNVSCC